MKLMLKMITEIGGQRYTERFDATRLRDPRDVGRRNRDRFPRLRGDVPDFDATKYGEELIRAFNATRNEWEQPRIFVSAEIETA